MSVENEPAVESEAKEEIQKEPVSKPAGKKSSPVFLLLMLGIFGLFIAAWAHDQYMLPGKTATAFNEAGKIAANDETSKLLKETRGVPYGYIC